MAAIDMPTFYATRRPDGVMADVQVYLGKITPNQRERIQNALESIHSVNTVELIQTSSGGSHYAV